VRSHAYVSRTVSRSGRTRRPVATARATLVCMSGAVSGSIQNGMCSQGTSPAAFATSDGTNTMSAREPVPAMHASATSRAV